MQKIIIIGNLGSDPEARYTQDGKERLTINVGVNERRRVPPSNEWTDHTNWYRVTVMGRQLEYVRNLAKGNRVHVIGNLSVDAYMSRDNEPRAGLNIWADEVTNLSPRDSGGERAQVGDRDQGGTRHTAPVGAGAGQQDATNLEDLPF